MFIYRIANALQFTSNVIFQILLCMKLQSGDDSSLSWGQTFIPWYIWEGLNLFSIFPTAIKKYPEINEQNQEDAMNPETALYMQILEIQMARATSSSDINIEKHGAGPGVAVRLRLGSDGTRPSSPIMTLHLTAVEDRNPPDTSREHELLCQRRARL